MVKASNGNIDIKVINKYVYACVGVFILGPFHSPFSIDTFITRIFPFLALPNTLANCSFAKE